MAENSNIDNAQVRGTISGKTVVGGIVGYVDSRVGVLTRSPFKAGLNGENQVYITNSLFTGKINPDDHWNLSSRYIGGISGVNARNVNYECVLNEGIINGKELTRAIFGAKYTQFPWVLTNAFFYIPSTGVTNIMKTKEYREFGTELNVSNVVQSIRDCRRINEMSLQNKI